MNASLSLSRSKNVLDVPGVSCDLIVQSRKKNKKNYCATTIKYFIIKTDLHRCYICTDLRKNKDNKSLSSYCSLYYICLLSLDDAFRDPGPHREVYKIALDPAKLSVL